MSYCNTSNSPQTSTFGVNCAELGAPLDSPEGGAARWRVVTSAKSGAMFPKCGSPLPILFVLSSTQKGSMELQLEWQGSLVCRHMASSVSVQANLLETWGKLVDSSHAFIRHVSIARGKPAALWQVDVTSNHLGGNPRNPGGDQKALTTHEMQFPTGLER